MVHVREGGVGLDRIATRRVAAFFPGRFLYGFNAVDSERELGAGSTPVRGRDVYLGFALGVVTSVFVVAAPFGPRTSQAAARASFDRAEFHRAVDESLDRYVDKIDEPRVLADGLKHILAGLDPHSYYLTEAERKALTSHAPGRTGLTTAMHYGSDPGDRWLEVVAVVPGSPAANARLGAGDHILYIRGRRVSSLLSQPEAEALLRGRVGETIHLTVQRRHRPGAQDVSLRLREVSVKDIEARLVDAPKGKVAHVRIHEFAAGVGGDLKRELDGLRRAAGRRGLKGIVLDLRTNPGGQVDEALIIADAFVAKGVLTRTRGRGGRILREEKAHKAGTDLKTPIVVLQDRHTASAAELLAAALKENGRAKVVGERSYGKGTVQHVRGLKDGSLLTLTIARYYTPKDRSIDGVGIEPDIKVPMTSGTQDPGLTAALGEF